MSEPERAYLHVAFAPGACIKMNRDGGFRIVLDVPECDAAGVAVLQQWRAEGMRALFERDSGSELINKTEQDNGKTPIQTRPKRKSERTPAKKPSTD